jgi:DNA-binding MarR family transcriptional regulator
MNQKMNQLLDRQPPAGPRFTEKQGQYLAFIWAYSQINGRSPAERDLQRYFGVTPPSVHQMVTTLDIHSEIETTSNAKLFICWLVVHLSEGR